MALCLVTLMMGCYASSVWAVPAHPQPMKMVQPDGTVVTIRLCGDEWLNAQVTTDGYTVVKDQRGFYVYASLEAGQLVPTAQVAHDEADRLPAERSFLSTIPKGLMPQMTEETQAMRRQAQRLGQQQRAQRRASKYDYTKFRGLLILAEFNDRQFSSGDYKSYLEQLVNKENFTTYGSEVFTGSVRDYFSDNTGGRFKPVFDVVGPYTLDYSQYDPKKSSNAMKIVLAAIAAADPDVDFTAYDGDEDGFVDLVYVIFAGYGSNYSGNDSRLVWPHRYAAFKPVDGLFTRDYACSTEFCGYEAQPESVRLDGIGTICHEFMHVLGVPDFYDIDDYGSGGLSCTPDTWSVMANGMYNNYNRTPVGLSLFERWYTGLAEDPETIGATTSASSTWAMTPMALMKSSIVNL